MPLPPAVLTCTVNVGTPFGLTGRTGFVHVIIRPLFGGTASRLIWTATGDPFESWAENLPSANGGRAPTVSLEIPYSDQPGFRDPAGNAVTMWPYQMTVTTFDPNGVQTGITTKEFTPLTTGPSVLDFDLIITEGEAGPVTGGSPVVLFVNGHSGPSITLTKADIGLPLVNNTPDSAKPVSTLQQAAINQAISDLKGGVSTAYDTLQELAASLASDESGAAALTALVTAVRNLTDSTHVTALTSFYGPKVGSDAWLKAWAASIDTLIQATTITRDSNGAATGAGVIWPDGTTGTYTGTPSSGFLGAIDAYTVTYVGGTTKTVTQPAMTRDTNGAVTVRPAMTVA